MNSTVLSRKGKIIILDKISNNKFSLFILFHVVFFQFLISQNQQSFNLLDKDKVIKLPEMFVIETEIDPDVCVSSRVKR